MQLAPKELPPTANNKIVGTLRSFKYSDCVTNEDEATNYSSEVLSFLDVPGLPPNNLDTTEGWLGSHHASKFKPSKTMQRNAFGDNNVDDQCDSRDDTQKKKFQGEEFHRYVL
ncbi:unnamed protein product [Euphydryas editha]|uniref:Uncharacterized protein n=1 Tax=Euphydryas editha TaxID=104508 RepID=A0AAU9UZZ1_EUPED|nr:unnamed protein product [Euphydryas editha]